MSEENKKIVIVVGAGASADFHPKHFSFPVGEALIKMISNSRKVFDFFGNEILDEIYQDIKVKINWDKHHQNGDIMSVACKEKFLKYFFEYLKNPIYQNKEEASVIFNFDESIGASIEQYESEIGAMATEFAMSREKLRIKKFSNKTDFFKFIDIDNSKIREATENQGNKEGIRFLNNLLRENFRIKISQLEDAQIRQDIQILLPNGLKLPSLFESILEVSSSRYLQISRLVYYYQPFSIDELLDSIKTKKIDVLEPLKIKKEDLKQSEEQFRNELINAGKTLIALFLLRSEKRDLFDNPNPQNDAKIWYRHIRNLIINSGKDSAEIKKQIQNITIISFNYDRSLDYYLHTRLSDYYGKIKERVFYPYGKLAVDNWNCDDYGKYNKDGKFNPYNDDELREIEELGQGLRVIGELDEKNNDSGNKNLEKADNLRTLLALNESRKIYFLGFAFHQQNCELLQLKKLLTLKVDQRNIYYTNFDESEIINKMVNEIFGIGKATWKLTLHDSKRKGVYDALMHDFKLGF